MPTYVYKFVDSGETIEVQQAFTDDALTEVAHPSDGKLRPVKKVFQPVGITFKGGGFYKTDSKGGSSATTPPGSQCTHRDMTLLSNLRSFIAQHPKSPQGISALFALTATLIVLNIVP